MTDLEKLCERLRITAEVTYGNAVNLDRLDGNDWRQDANPWTVRLRLRVPGNSHYRTLTVPFWTGSGITREPTAADVLACLCSDASACDHTFEGWCGDFGYDTDSRSAEATYKACVASGKRVRRFLGDHFAAVCEAEH